MPSIINASTSGAGGVITTADASGVLQLQTAGATAVTVDASQNVGIGTSSPATKLQVGSTRQFFVQDDLGGNEIYNSGLGFSAYFDTQVATPQFILPAGRNTNGGAGISSSYNGDLDFYTYNNGSTAAGSIAVTTARRMRITSDGLLQFNSGYGSVATAYGCRAWVNFNGTGTVAIRGSGNVSSITDGGTGAYTINFTTAMPDVNYSVTQFSGITTGNGFPTDYLNTQNTGNFAIVAGQNATVVSDNARICLAVYR
jgi:hypothetical protein